MPYIYRTLADLHLLLYNFYMIYRKKFFLILSTFAVLFPLTASVTESDSKFTKKVSVINPYEKNTQSNKYIKPVFFSRKKLKDSEDDLKQQELDEARAKAEADIAARKKTDQAAKNEKDRLEAERKAIEQQEADRLEAERQEAERLEAERLQAEKEKEKAEADRLAKIEAERLENERKLAEVAANRYKKEYLSDYIVPDVPDIPEDEVKVYEPIPNPNETDASGCTLLMRAAKSGNEWQVQRLIEAGADLNLKDKDGWTALMYSVRYNEGIECTELLIDAGADIKAKNSFGSSALVIASCYNNNPKVLSKLLTKYKSSDNEILRAFVVMLSEQNISEDALISKVNLFVEKSVPLNSLFDGKTPLMYAALYGNSNQVLKILLENDASPKVRSTEGKTAFDYAANNKNIAHDETYWALNVK